MLSTDVTMNIMGIDPALGSQLLRSKSGGIEYCSRSKDSRSESPHCVAYRTRTGTFRVAIDENNFPFNTTHNQGVGCGRSTKPAPTTPTFIIISLLRRDSDVTRFISRELKLYHCTTRPGISVHSRFQQHIRQWLGRWRTSLSWPH